MSKRGEMQRQTHHRRGEAGKGIVREGQARKDRDYGYEGTTEGALKRKGKTTAPQFAALTDGGGLSFRSSISGVFSIYFTAV